MLKLTAFLLMGLLMILGQALAQDTGSSKVAISLSDLTTPPGADLSHVVKAVRTDIINRLSQISCVAIYPSETVLDEYIKKPEILLTADKVKLLRIRRESGLDGLIFGSLEEKDNKLILTIHLIDFSSGKVFFSGTYEDSFGSSLLLKIEEKISDYVNSLISYYDRILSVISEPDGAEIWINGQKAGITPAYNLIVKDRQVQVQVKKQGYIPYETNIELDAGQKGLVSAQLYKYSLSVTSQPPQASVLVNGQIIGLTPVENLVLEQSEFTVDIVKNGYIPFRQFVSLKPGQQAYLHAELYDVLADRIRNRRSPWKIDSHELSFVQSMDIQNLKEIDVEAFPVSSFQYCARFGKFSAGINMGLSIINAKQHFDTFLGTGEGYEQFDINVFKGTAFAKYNILEKVNVIGLYLGAFTGFLQTTSNHPYAPSDLSELRKLNPILGGEMGVDLYVARPLKLSVMAGSYYGGKIEYAIKKASYWGSAQYSSKTLKLRPFYIGVALALTVSPFFM